MNDELPLLPLEKYSSLQGAHLKGLKIVSVDGPIRIANCMLERCDVSELEWADIFMTHLKDCVLPKPPEGWPATEGWTGPYPEPQEHDLGPNNYISWTEETDGQADAGRAPSQT